MAAQNESGGGSGVPFNLKTVLALFTVIVGVFLVSQRLTSDRPLATASRPMETIGDQTVEARLWEDPFAIWERLGDQGSKGMATNGYTELQSQIRARSGKRRPPLLLPVMLEGGGYSEARESRVRSRFAIVSALGRAGYVPEDAEHIGALRMPWPSAAALASNQTNVSNLEEWIHTTNTLEFSYEWYRGRTFYPKAEATAGAPVLVLWLDDGQFEDQPLLRLALLLHEWIADTATNHVGLATNVAIIGPRRSATLRAMLSGDAAGKDPLVGLSASVRQEVTNVLQRAALFTSTASAMDEVLVLADRSDLPRGAVAAKLARGIFRGVHNYAATDDQLADEMLDELRLRHVDLRTNGPHHLVLISEWDTFYGRMLSLTYAATLAVSNRLAGSRAEFVSRYQKGEPVWPSDRLHTFFYLRGLDGQTSTADPQAGNSREETLRSGPFRPDSLEALARWTPDANKPEGRAQLDYLSRLGKRIARLGEGLWLTNRSTIGAIGIVGSDVYDTLLILQALRPLFPDAVFFTTDLDARLWQPTEWKWSRNLVVVSGYGLQLSPELQQDTPPFRESLQTAQFAATLAALGNTKLAASTAIQPRRFEIGRGGPVDLSLSLEGELHPESLRHQPFSKPISKTILPLLGSLLFAGVLGILVWRPWRRLTTEAGHFQAESLWLREEDIGGLEGFRIIQRTLQESHDPLAVWIHRRLQEKEPKTAKEQDLANSPPRGVAGAAQDTLLIRTEDDRMQEFLDFLNYRLQESEWVPDAILGQSKLIKDPAKEHSDPSEPAVAETKRFALGRIKEHRLMADEVLGQLLDPTQPDLRECGDDHAFTVGQAAAAARKAGWETQRERRIRQRGFWISMAICAGLGIALLASCLHDTYHSREGEPFSLVSGASVWPSEWLRLAALVMAVYFVAESYSTLRTGALDLTRRYRLFFSHQRGSCEWTLPVVPSPVAAISANAVWTRYQQMGRWRSRVCRILPLLGAYLLLGLCLMLLAPFPASPLRGPVAFWWDRGLVVLSSLAFLFLNFWTMDAARLCQWFIEQISEVPTRYPKAARDYFSRIRGGAPKYVLNEWLDLRIIAELTERVGRLIYFPFIVFFLLLLARNNWWDRWSWPWTLVIVFGLNLALAVASVVILQHAARRARTAGLERLETKLNKLKAEMAPSEVEKKSVAVAQAEQLLEEMMALRSGAFAAFWENPVVGALLLPSGGTALVELLPYLIGR